MPANLVPATPPNVFIGPIPPRDAQDTATIAANQAYFAPFTVTRAQTVTQVSYRPSTQSGNIDFGIYDASYNRLASTGSTACPATGALRTTALTAPVTLYPGRLYRGAYAADNATVAMLSGAISASPAVGDANLLSQQASAFPLPATASPSAAAGQRYIGMNFS